MSRLSTPLDLQAQLRPPPRRFNAAALADVVIIAVFFSLLGSRFLTPPGVSIDLPTSAIAEETGIAPAASLTVSGTGLDTDAADLPDVSVVTLRQSQLAIFEGDITSVEKLEPQMRAFLEARQPAHPVLLLKASEDVSVQTLLQVMEAAQAAGFKQVRIAARMEPVTP